MSTVKIPWANKSDKDAMVEWEEFLNNIRNSTPIDSNETEQEKAARIKKLEADPEAWFKYYFPKFCFCEPAKFHKESTKRVLKASRLYQRRAWARGLSKSTRRMFEVLFKKLARKFRTNALLISKSETNAIRLLATYRGNLEANNRIINDYGVQQKPGGKWAEEEFVTRDGSSFRAVGAEQNPRGAKLDEMRVNVVIFDDVDDDEVCQNPDRLQKRWDWIEQAVIPTVDISQDYFIFFDNNIIAEDSIAVRAAEFADDVELINIRDDNGKSVWIEKNSEADIDYMLSKVSYESGQKEYFNNPMGQGKWFPAMKWGKCPALSSLAVVQVYADPGTSNNDKPSAKSNAQNSHKAVFVVGSDGTDYYIYTGFMQQCGNSTFIDSYYECWDYTKRHKAQLTFLHIENNTLQNPFYEQVLLPLIYAKGHELQSGVLPITPDERIKPEKALRIEATLEPLNRLGHLILNVEEKGNPHMISLEAQFKAAKVTSKRLDGPDAIEGAIFLIKQRNIVKSVGGITGIRRPINPKRY